MAPSEWVEVCRLRGALHGGIGPCSADSVSRLAKAADHVESVPCSLASQAGSAGSPLGSCQLGSGSVTCGAVPCC